MKRAATNMSTWTVAILAMTTLAFAAACGSSKKLNNGGAKGTKKKPTSILPESEIGEYEGEGEEEEQEVEAPISKPELDLTKVGNIIGFKENDALVATFAALTRVNKAQVLESIRLTIPAPANGQPDQRTVANAMSRYDGLFGQLATGETPAEQTPAVVAATTKLAAHYCDALINGTGNEALRSQVLPGVNFASAPAALDLNATADVMVKAFWPMDIESGPDMGSSVQMFGEVLGAIRSSAPAATTPNIILGGCAVLLTSAPVTRL
jgi:hypothetical protein